MNRQRGFTLIEMLIALMIGTIVAASLTLITRSMAQSASNEQMNVEASQAARAGLDILRFDFMRAGMFYPANPRNAVNTNSLVSSAGTAGGEHQAYYRNPIVHLNRGNTNPDAVILVGNFIGDRTYEGEVDTLSSTITIRYEQDDGMCESEFNEEYAFAHLITATGQTHDVKVSQATFNSNLGCVLNIFQGELIDGAFGERNVTVAATQAVLYRVEHLPDRDVLMRYFVNYSGSNIGDIAANAAGLVVNEIDSRPLVVAENVVDFQVWFRPIDFTQSGSVANVVAYDSLATASGTTMTLPPPGKVLATSLGETASGNSLGVPNATNIQTGPQAVFPEHVRSAIISIAVRTERTDQSLEVDTDAGQVVQDELASAPVDENGDRIDVGNYRVRRYTVEVKLPNITSQMADFQYSGAGIAF